MRNLLSQRDKYLMNFADSVYDEYLKSKYGIQSCKRTGKLWLDDLRRDIANYQANDDGEALCAISIQHMGWLPVYYPTHDTSCEYRPPWADVSKYQIQTCHAGPRSIGMSYVGQNNSANIIEVNSGGCITRINVNPSITINNNNSSFVFTQNCADPQLVWYINHNLNLVPNVWSEDCNGDNISGVIDVINNNQITLTFSSAVAGNAYLS
jgi:hypothetical protein